MSPSGVVPPQDSQTLEAEGLDPGKQGEASPWHIFCTMPPIPVCLGVSGRETTAAVEPRTPGVSAGGRTQQGRWPLAVSYPVRTSRSGKALSGIMKGSAASGCSDLYPGGKRMLITGIVASPYKDGLSARMVAAALDRARQKGAETELVHLQDMEFKGCVACFACKRPGGEKNCHYKDALTPCLEQAWNSDGIIFGMPVIFYAEPGLFRNFFERFHFPWHSYRVSPKTWRTNPLRSVLIYTVEDSQADMENNENDPFLSDEPPFFWQEQGAPQHRFPMKKLPAAQTHFNLSRTFGECRILAANDVPGIDGVVGSVSASADAGVQAAHLRRAAEAGDWLARRCCG